MAGGAMMCPCGLPIDLRAIPDAEWASEQGRRSQARRKAPYVAGPGRPMCKCGDCEACRKRARRAKRAAKVF